MHKDNISETNFALISVLMFLCGLTYCYYVVFPLVFSFIDSFSPQSVQFAPDISESLGFILQMFIAFGFGFEISVIVVFFNLNGIVKLATLKNTEDMSLLLLLHFLQE